MSLTDTSAMRLDSPAMIHLLEERDSFTVHGREVDIARVKTPGFYWSQTRQTFVHFDGHAWRVLGVFDEQESLADEFGSTVHGPLVVDSSSSPAGLAIPGTRIALSAAQENNGFFFHPSHKISYERIGNFDGESWRFVGDGGIFNLKPITAGLSVFRLQAA